MIHFLKTSTFNRLKKRTSGRIVNFDLKIAAGLKEKELKEIEEQIKDFKGRDKTHNFEKTLAEMALKRINIIKEIENLKAGNSKK
ncbi:MAG: hypothetical protein V1824_00795 [archaeon]